MTPTKPQILVTNDDGADSPILLPLVRELSSFAQVNTVVPASECSWTSKVISRFKPIELALIERDGFTIHTLSGYPADCANIGIHNLSPNKPDLVVSGINIGSNAGLAFALSSGTIGAAVESFLSGVPAAAFSLELPLQGFELWRCERRLDPALDELILESTSVTGEIVAELLRGGLPEGSDIVAVNMPESTTCESPRRLTGMTQTGYSSLFARHETEPRFEFQDCQLSRVGEPSRGDRETLDKGEVSISPLRYSLDAPVCPTDRQRFEQSV